LQSIRVNKIIILVIKKLAIGLLLLILALGFGFWLYIRYFIPVPHETWTYTSISVTRKSDGLVLGSIKVENKKIINDIKDYKIKIFINKNKNSWETGELSYPIGGQTWTGSLWDGVRTTTIDNNEHLLSIYGILSDEFDSDFTFKLNKTREYGTKRGFK